jgi:hypothetical protein
LYSQHTHGHSAEVKMTVEENSTAVSRFCCGPLRGMQLDLVAGDDGTGPLLAQFDRRCGLPAPCPLIGQQITSYRNGTIIGHSSVPCYTCSPEIDVFDNRGRQLFKVVGTNTYFCQKPQFKIHKGYTRAGPVVGGFYKEWGGEMDACCAEPSSFSIDFPARTNLVTRTNLIGTSLLLDLVWFGAASNNQ